MAAQQRVSAGSSFQTNTFKPPLLKPKPNETYRENKSSESSKPTPPRTPVRKTPIQNFSNNISVSSASEKPAWIKNTGVGSTPTDPKPPDLPKPKISSISSLQSQFSRPQEHSPPSIPRPFQSANINLPLVKQNSFLKEQNSGTVKDGLQTSNTINSVFPKHHVMPKTTSVGTSVNQQRPQKESSDPSVPKKKSLPPLFTLGNPPQKPNRPPNFDLQRFRGCESSLNDDAGMKIPVSLAPSPIPQSKNTSQQLDQEESYDDVGVMNPPPLPSLEGRSTKKTEEEFSDDEMYEDLDERWKEQEEKPKKSQDTKTGKNETKHSQITKEKQAEELSDEELYEDLEVRCNDQEPKQGNNQVEMKEQERKAKKEDKQKLQEEKRLQKAKEKREKEAKRKFKIKGPVCVIQQGKARLDCKGGKADLPLRQGEIIDIVRITDNPEGLWLARNMEGYYGYVKSDNIACDGLKEQATTGNSQSGADIEVYDDVGAPADVCSAPKSQEGGNDDTYDDVCSPEEDMSFPPPPPIIDGMDEVYDDVDSQDFPPPPPPGSFLQLSPKGKPEVSDPKKQKKFEKEEKEFRKKFKFEGEIQVLYDVTVASTLTTKKWGNKDLPLKPGEVINVIVKPTDGKLIGRNAQGKFGYVAMANIAQDSSDIYDDVGEDCIYDNE